MGRGNSLPPDCVGRKKELWKTNNLPFGEEHLLIELLKHWSRSDRLRIAEVGVAQGTLSKRVVGRFSQIVENYVCVDPWRPYPEWSDRKLEEHELSVKYWDEMCEKLCKWATGKNNVTIARMTSVEAAMEFPDSYFDIVYLDAVHDFPNTINDLWSWLPKVKDGGVLCGHDYVKRFRGLIEAVDLAFEDEFFIEDDTGGSWWVFLNEENKEKYLERIVSSVGPQPTYLLVNAPNLFGQEVLP